MVFLSRIDPRLEKPRPRIIRLNVEDFPDLFLRVCKPALAEENLSQGDASRKIGTVQRERFLVVILGLINVPISRGNASKEEVGFRVRTVDCWIASERRLSLIVFAREELQLAEQHSTDRIFRVRLHDAVDPGPCLVPLILHKSHRQPNGHINVVGKSLFEFKKQLACVGLAGFPNIEVR